MKRRSAALLASLLLVGGGAWLALRPSREPVPLAWLAPSDVLAWAEFPDLSAIDRLPKAWTEPFRARLEEARPHIDGPFAVYIDREGEWVSLARLTRTARLFGNAVILDGAAVSARTPAALERHRARKGRLPENDAFRELGSRCYVNLDALKLSGRLRDYGAAGFEIEPGPPLVLRGRATYRGHLFRMFLEQYLHAPRLAAPAGKAPLAATLTEPVMRFWEEVTHDLPPVDREKLDREAMALSRDFLEGRGLREFVGRLGASWGVTILPTPHGPPALAGWLDLPDASTRDTLAKMLHRTAHDVGAYARDRGQAPSWELAVDGALWRVKIADPVLARQGPAFSPAYTFQDLRLLFTTGAPVFAAPPAAGAEGTDHSTIRVEVPPFLEALRSLAPFLTDLDFRADAEREAGQLFDRMFSPAVMGALKKRFPEPYDLTRYLAAQRLQLAVTALNDLAGTPRYGEALRKTHAWMDDLEGRLVGLQEVSFRGRFTGEGLRFELRLTPK